MIGFGVVFIFLAGLGIVFAVMSYRANSVRLPETLKQPPPEMRKVIGQWEGAGRREERETGALAGVKSYEGFLKYKMKTDPGNRACTAYLELMNEMDRKKPDLYRDYYKVFPHLFRDPILEKQRQCLNAHAGLIALIHRLANAGALPGITMREELEEFAPREIYIAPQFIMIRFYQKIILQHARMCLADRNTSASCEALGDGLRLAAQLHEDERPINWLWMATDLNSPLALIRNLLEEPSFPVAQFKELSEVLARMEKELYPPGILASKLKPMYLDDRRWVVEELCGSARAENGGSWRSPIFGWYFGMYSTVIRDDDDELSGKFQGFSDVAEYQNRFFMRIRIPRFFSEEGNVEIPRVERFAVTALAAMQNKRHSDEAMRGFDRVWGAWLAAAEEGVSVKDAKIPDADKENFIVRNYYRKGMPDPGYVEWSIKKGLALFHLNRLGLLVRIDEGKAMALRQENLGNDFHNPWRDPFTGKMMKIASGDRVTTISSEGADWQGRRDELSFRIGVPK